MKFKLVLFFILGIFFFSCHAAIAQSKKTGSGSSASDSLKAVRKLEADNRAALKKYRHSRHYKDSVKIARRMKSDASKSSGKAKAGKDTKLSKADSLMAARRAVTDSIHEKQEKRAEEAAALKEYKGSKRYADSVAILKRTRSDSMKQTLQAHKDSIMKVRQHDLDSAKAVRKHITDSVKMVRTHFTDSLKIVRKRKLDSLNKAKMSKNKTLLAKDKKAEQNKRIALDIKMKQKHEAYTNKSMLKKKWTPFRRFTQNSFTHYNYYYNANRKLEEANANMLRGGAKENYDTLIRLYPFDPNRDSALLSADMDSIIRKVSVGIQIHDPRTKWANDLFMLMGQAYYFKGRYNEAGNTFRYIISADEETRRLAQKGKSAPKSKTGPSVVEGEKSGLGLFQHKSVHNDAILWLARTFVQAKQVENGQAVLSLLAADAKLPDDMKGKVAAGKAFGYLADNNFSGATEQLQIVVEDGYLPDWLRIRAAFLRGQLLQNDTKYAEAAASFERCLDFFPKIEMDFYARKYIAYNILMAGGQVGDGMKPLKKILNDGKYVNYYDQVYFVLGSMAAKANKPDDAIEYLTQSARTPKATKKQKAISFATLGEVYYGMGNYAAAKSAYDSAAKYTTSGTKDPAVLAAAQKSKGLQEVTQPLDVIHDQDSLLELADMSKKEQLSVVHKYLQALEKKMQDSIQNAEDAGLTPIAAPADAANEPGDAANWYFANTTLMQQGALDFKKKWGSRPLTDNWRRGGSQGAGSTAANQSGLEEDRPDESRNDKQNGMPTEESLLARIPDTKEKKDAAVKSIQKAYLMLAKAYYKQLDDLNQTVNTLDTLDSRYPNHNLREEELYLRYQVAIRQNMFDSARKYSAELLAKFPKSQYAQLVTPRKDEPKSESAASAKAVAAYYEETYNLIINHQYTEALARIEAAKKQYDNPVFRKRFQIAEAMSYAGQGNYDMSDTIIARFVAANPSDTLTAWANEVSAYVKDVRKNGKPSWYTEKPLAEVKPAEVKKPDVPKPEVKPAPPRRPVDVPDMYAYKPAEEHYGIMMFPSVDSRTGRLKQAIRDDDSVRGKANTHTVLIDMYDRTQVVLVVKSFGNAEMAKAYMDTLAVDSVYRDYKSGELQSYIISASNYKKMFYEKATLSYKGFFDVYYKKP